MECKEIWNMFVEVTKILVDKGVIVVGMLVSWFFYAVGGKDKFIYCLFGAMVIDFITGIFKSTKSGSTNSKVGFKGIPRKAAMFCVVALAELADEILETKGFKYNCRYLVICFYFANEGLSILENVINAGLPVPKQLKNMLEQCRDKQEIKKKE